MTIAELTRKTRKEKSLTLGEFGAAIQINGWEFPRQAISNWEAGRQRPSYQFLLLCAMKTNDWRRDWALNCLAILQPEVFAPTSKEQS